MAHTNPGIVGEVMNLDDFLEELSDPDPKSAVMLNNENSNDNFDGRKKIELSSTSAKQFRNDVSCR